MRKIVLLFGLCSLAFLFNFTVDNRKDTNELQTIAQTTWSDGDYTLMLPNLPDDIDDYSYEKPEHFNVLSNLPGTGVAAGAAPIDNNLATLGRVLFYDKNLSKNKTVSCGSCHKQEFGFADNKPTSPGFNDQLNTRNAISLADLDYTPYSELFWDDRDANLEAMLVKPFINQDEMGFNNMQEALDEIEKHDYYTGLFELAFEGTDEITEQRIGEALSHFVRAISAVNTKLDVSVSDLPQNAFNEPIPGWTESENLGRTIFQSDCQNCHSSVMTAKTYSLVGMVFNAPHNTGLDETTDDPGVGGILGNSSFTEGMFKTPTLKNVEFSAPYMHDGRFATLEEVVDFYSEGMKMHPNSAFNPNSITNSQYYSNNPPLPDSDEGFDYTDVEKAALVDFLHTLTDYTLIDDPKFSDPFVSQGGDVGIGSLEDLNVSVYPNPTVDVVNIELNDSFNENVTISVYDLNGQLLRTEGASGKFIQVERGALPVGNYLIKVNDGSTMASTKVIFR